MKIVAFAASNSTKSINKQLVAYAAGLVQNGTTSVEILDLNDYEMPIFSTDREDVIGQHQLASDFMAKLAQADALIISYAEHNGSYSTAYKNILDWCSRITREVFQNKPAVLLSTSPGAGGGARALKTACEAAPYFGVVLKASLSIPSFGDNFDISGGVITNTEINQKLKQALATLEE